MQVDKFRFQLSTLELAVIDEALKLMETAFLGHPQPGFSNRGFNLANNVYWHGVVDLV